jgi:hypothetical protein
MCVCVSDVRKSKSEKSLMKIDFTEVVADSARPPRKQTTHKREQTEDSRQQSADSR